MMGTVNAAKPGKPRTLGFDFEAITLDEVARLVPQANQGKYFQLREDVLKRMQANPVPCKFGFLQNGVHELPEKERRGICGALNGAFFKQKMPWRVTYSGIGKCFVIKPYQGRGGKQRHFAALPKPANDGTIESAIARIERAAGLPLDSIMDNRKLKWAMCAVLRDHLGFKASAIARKLDKTPWSITTYCEKANKGLAKKLQSILGG